MARKTNRSRPLPFVAFFLAWLIPGAAHAYIGRPRRAIIIFVVIGATFWSGIAVGGILTIDYHNERWWFAAQMLTGIHGVWGWHRQQTLYTELVADSAVGLVPTPGTYQRELWNYRLDRRLARDNLALSAPVATLARAYTGVAGLLNLMCVFDAVMLSLLRVTGEPKEAPASGKKEQDKK
ncbi:MAG: DUF6677 family protein [Planctomycetota bacterium]|jgi:TM2 domain-containing membrane protein YozV